MANRYWVGGTAAWDGTAGTKWAATSGGAGGESVPTSADAVFFTNLSTGTCTISSGNTGAASINCTGFTGTLAGTAAISVAGTITLVTGQGFTYTGTITITSGGFLTTAGKTLAGVTFSGAVGAQLNLGSALTLTGNFTVTGGTFTTTASSYTITASRFIISGTTSKSVQLNASTITLSLSGAAFDYSGSNLTFTAGTSTINITNPNANLNGGAGLTFRNVTFSGTSGLDSISSVIGANTFNQLTLTPPAAGVKVFSFSNNQTATTLVTSGGTAVRRLFLRSSSTGFQRTLTVTTWSSRSDVDFRDIAFNTAFSGTRFGDCGNNTNITFSVSKTVYWNLTGSQNWSATGWATLSGGTPSVNNFPLAQDTAIFDDSGAATSVKINTNWNIGTLDMSARTTAMTLSSAGQSPIFYGDLTLSSAITYTSTISNLYFSKDGGTQTINSAGKTFYSINSDYPTTTVVLGSAITLQTGVFNSMYFIRGASFDAATYSVTANNLAFINAGTVNIGSATWSITGIDTVWNVSGSTVVAGTAEIILTNTTTSARTFDGNGNTYGKLTIGGTTGTSTLTFTGANTFSELASTKTVAHTIIFPNATTTVGAFTVQGSAGNVVTLSRTGASGTFTLAKSGGGVVGSDYLSISNSTASPSSTWYAGANSTDGGGNTGWIFDDAPAAGGGNFLAFFM